jgi:hypothetical protein
MKNKTEEVKKEEEKEGGEREKESRKQKEKEMVITGKTVGKRGSPMKGEEKKGK